MTKQKRLNDYLITVRYPFGHSFYLFQAIRKGVNRDRLTLSQTKEAYVSQMQQTLNQMPPGQYKTITQPMFTRVILKSPRVKVLYKKKAYRKDIGHLMKRVYAPFVCPNRSNRKKQFYYIKFKIADYHADSWSQTSSARPSGRTVANS